LAKGYTILTRRYRSKRGEIDVVALDGETLVFVEVKERAQGDPELAVSLGKQQRIADAALRYQTEFEQGGRDVRFDTIAIVGDTIRHHENAF
jgi:putative endonuclease